jgi:lipopolysaccharide export LptBFGC system permease protein LptF
MSLQPDGISDAAARLIVTATFFLWNLYEGSIIEAPYPAMFVKLYAWPIWRFVLALLVLSAAYWCPRVGAMIALAVFFYIEDLEKLSRPWVKIVERSSSSTSKTIT